MGCCSIRVYWKDNIFEFYDTQVSTIMTHMTDIIGLSINALLHEAIETVGSERFSRISVYEDDIDNIVGILYTKDLLKLVNENNQKNFNIQDFITKPFLVSKFGYEG